MRALTIALALSLAALLPVTAFAEPAPSAGAQAVETADWRETYAYHVGIQAVIFGYPAVKNLTTRYFMVAKPAGVVNTPTNSWFHMRRASDATDKYHSSITADLLYSAGWFDLRAEPLVLTVPDDNGLYYGVQLMEMYSDIFGYIGTRQTGGKAGNYLLVGPGWKGKVPPRAKIAGVIRSPTPTGMWLLRIVFRDRKQLDETFRQQDRFKITGWNEFRRPGKAPPPSRTRDVLAPAAPNSTLPFFTSLNRAMTENPPPPKDGAIVAQLATVGVGPGQSDDFAKLDPATLRGLARAEKDGLAFIRQVSVAGGNAKVVNHWAYGQANWGRTAETSDTLTRAATQSFAGLQEHWIEEVVKLRAHHDGDGARLDGAKANYVLRFAPGQIPKARSFWSVTVYDESFDLVANPINRYSLGSVDKDLVKDSDGGLTLYLQPDAPDAKYHPNWIPTPRGQFNLFMRAYLPDQALQRQDYTPPPVKKVPG